MLHKYHQLFLALDQDQSTTVLERYGLGYCHGALVSRMLTQD